MWGRCCLLTLALVLPQTLYAQDVKPLVTARVKSIEGLVADFRYVLKYANKLEEADKLDEGITFLEGSGLDLKKPIGGYILPAERPEDSPIVLMLPLADELTFFNTLGNFFIKPNRQPDGSYLLGIPNSDLEFDLYVRVAHKHLYVTGKNRDNLNPKKLLAPDKILAGAETSVLSVNVDLTSAPDALRQYAMDAIEKGLTKEREKEMPFEQELQRKLRFALLDFASQNFAVFAKGAASFTLNLDLDKKAEEVSAKLVWKGADGSEFAKQIKALESRPSRFAALADKSAASVVLHAPVPETLKPVLQVMFDEAKTQALKGKTAAAEQELIGQTFDAWKPTIKQGRLDLGVVLVGPDNQGQYRVAAGMDLADGAGIEASFEEIYKVVPLPAKLLFQIEAKKDGAQKSFRGLTAGRPAYLAEALGEKIEVQLAVQKDTLWILGDPDGSNRLKETLAVQATKPGAVFQAEVSLAHLARLFPDNERKAAHQTWEGDPRGTDRVSLRLAGGDALELSFRGHLRILTFLANIEAIKRGN